MLEQRWPLWRYTSRERSYGQIQPGTYTGEWFDCDSVENLFLQGTITNSGGTTQVFIDFSVDKTGVDHSTDDLAGKLGPGRTSAGTMAVFPYARVRIVQSGAPTTQVGLCLKGL